MMSEALTVLLLGIVAALVLSALTSLPPDCHL